MLDIPRQQAGHASVGTHPKGRESACDHQPQILQSRHEQTRADSYFVSSMSVCSAFAIGPRACSVRAYISN